MVSGHTQVVDAAFVEANASTDSLKRKALLKWQLLKGEADQVSPAELSVQDLTFTALEKTDNKSILRLLNFMEYAYLSSHDRNLKQMHPLLDK